MLDSFKNLVASPGDSTGMHGPTPVLERIKQFAGLALTKKPKPEMTDEVAAPQIAGPRALWDQSVARGLKPERLAIILQETIRGDHRHYLQLAEEMEERYPHYASVLGTRKRALSRLKPSIRAADLKKADAKIVAAVEDLMSRPNFRHLLRHLTDAFGKGFSAVEIMWREEKGQWVPEFEWRDPKYFTFDYVSRSEPRLSVLGTLDGAGLDPGKWIVHTPMLKSGIPIRGGFARLAAWPFLFWSFSIKDWAQFLDVFGMPIRVGKYHPSATAEDRRKLLQAVTQIASDAAAIIPESMMIELLEAKGASPGATTPFEGLCRFLDEQLSKAVLGQTMTVENGGSLAQAHVHNQIRIDILEDDADQLAVTLNRDLVAPYVIWNFGADAYRPYVELPVAEPQDVAALSNALALLVPLGLKVSSAEVREKIGVGTPEDGDELLTPPPTPAPGLKPDRQKDLASAAANLMGLFGPGCPSCGETKTRFERNLETPSADALDRLGEEETAQWEAAIGPTIQDVLDAARTATNYEEFTAALNALYAGLDTSALQQRLAVTGAIGRGYGLAKGQRDG